MAILTTSAERSRTIPPTFFAQNVLTPDDHDRCLATIHRWYPHCSIVPLATQGGCSLTLLVTPIQGLQQIVVQLRLPIHAIDPVIARSARAIYGMHAPELLRSTRLLDGLQVCAMTRIPGASFDALQPRHSQVLTNMELNKLSELMRGFALFFAKGWKSSAATTYRGSVCSGKIGSSITPRLETLEQDLPFSRLRQAARRVRDATLAGGLNALPVVLNHGDFLPGNVMVDPVTWSLCGLVDWAEAEFLPFGMMLYGIEHTLGFLTRADDGMVTWKYYKDRERLRAVFWRDLLHEINVEEGEIIDAIKLARQVGILLWHGFAWDGGRIDRVINPADDAEELAYLYAFLEVGPDESRSKLS